MFGLRRRLRGLLFLAVGVSCLAVPLALPALFGVTLVPTVPTLAALPTLLGLVPPTLAGAGAVLAVAGIAAFRDRQPSARSAFAAPALGLLVVLAAALGSVAAETATARATAGWLLTVPPALQFAAGSVVAGSAVAPVTLGAAADDVPALIAGAVLILGAVSASPAPAFAALAGLGGVLAVAVAWTVDADGWHP